MKFLDFQIKNRFDSLGLKGGSINREVEYACDALLRLTEEKITGNSNHNGTVSYLRCRRKPSDTSQQHYEAGLPELQLRC